LSATEVDEPTTTAIQSKGVAAEVRPTCWEEVEIRVTSEHAIQPVVARKVLPAVDFSGFGEG
jgi:hypothetical protein